MKNTKYNTQDVKKRCEDKLEISFRDSKEFNGWVRMNNKKIARITVPKGKKDIPPKTYKSMAKSLYLSVDQFDDLLECPLGWKQYEEIARESIE